MKRSWSHGIELTSVGITLVIATLLGYFGGAWLDGKLGTEPALGAVGLLLGAAAGFVQLFRVADPNGLRFELCDAPLVTGEITLQGEDTYLLHYQFEAAAFGGGHVQTALPEVFCFRLRNKPPAPQVVVDYDVRTAIVTLHPEQPGLEEEWSTCGARNGTQRGVP